MSSTSKYPILKKRRIDQWKAAELKAELKRRNLSFRGLKDDLIKRLDKAIRNERDNAEQTNGLHVDGAPPLSDGGDSNQEHASIGSEPTKETNGDTNMFGKVDDVQVQAEKTNDSPAAVDEGILQEVLSVNQSPNLEAEVIHVTTLETIITVVSETVVSEAALTVEDLHNIENKDNESQLDSEDIKAQLGSEDTKPQLDDVNMEPQPADLVHHSSAPHDQESEVSPVLGSQVRTDSISTGSVRINEMIELKENISADHVKLELDVKQEMVDPSSSIIAPDASESHPVDVEESHVTRDVVESPVKEDIEEKHNVKDMIVGLHKKHDGADVGLIEKLILDRSSGDDSIAIEDAKENKADSGNTPDEMGEKNVQIKGEGPIYKEEKFADIAMQGSTTDTENSDIENDVSSLPSEKTKLNGVGNESGKGQCRWNAENLKVLEPQNAAQVSTSNSKDILQSSTPKCNLSDSTPSEDLSEMDMSGDFVEIILGFIATPRELCRMARVSKKFSEIAYLDKFWNQFLLGLENVPNLPIFPSKKELYFHICDNPIRLRAGSSILAMERNTGHRSYLIGVENLLMGPPVVWSLIDNYLPSLFEKVQRGDFAEFVFVNGGGGAIKSNTIEGGILSTGVDYIVYLVFHSIEHDLPNEGPFETTFLLTQHRKDGIVNIGQDERIPHQHIVREDGWMKMEIALFRNEEPCDSEISFLIYPAANTYNIIVEGIEFRAIPMLNERLE